MTPFLNLEIHGGGVNYDCQCATGYRLQPTVRRYKISCMVPANRANLPDYTVS